MRYWIAGLLVPLLLAAGDVSYTIKTVAGGTYAGDARPARYAQIGSPEGLVADSAGNLYIADALDHRIRKVGRDGYVSTIAGDGHPGFRGDGGPAVEAQLNQPYGLALDAHGNLYVADLGNARVRRIAPDGTIQTIAGGGASDGDAIDALSARLTQPRDLAVDSAGTVYVSDFADGYVYRIARTGIISRAAGTLAEPLNAPAGLALDGRGRLYIAESGAARVRRLEDGRLATLIPTGLSLVSPTGLAFDRDGVLYVTDRGNRAVIRAGSAWTPVASAPALTSPRAVCFDMEGTAYVADTIAYQGGAAGLVWKLATDSALTGFAGDGSFRPAGDGGPAWTAHLSAPTGLALGRGGELFISERTSGRVRRVAGGAIETAAAGLSAPGGLASAGAGTVLVAESGAGRVSALDGAGTLRQLAAGLTAPESVATDAEGNVYVADAPAHVVRRITPSGEVRQFAGRGMAGYSGDGGLATAALLNAPSGVAVDAAGNVTIADTGNNVLRRVATDGRIVTVATGLKAPAAVASDGDALLVSDTGNHRVVRVEKNGRLRVVAGTAAAGFGGDGGPAEAAQVHSPAGLAVDGDGNVYVADRGNHRIRKLEPVEDPLKPGEVQVFSVVNAASMLPGPIAPGELVSIFGSGIGPGTGVQGGLHTEAGGFEVRFNGEPAPLLYVQSGQVNAQAPYSIAGREMVEVEIRERGAPVARFIAPVAAAAPGIFAVAGGMGQAAALNQNGSANSTANPAARGSVVVLYATGEGQTAPAGVTGRLAGTPLPRPVAEVEVKIGGRAAAIDYAGAAPGFAGLMQVNARVPVDIPLGAQHIELRVGGVASQPGITVAVK